MPTTNLIAREWSMLTRLKVSGFKNLVDTEIHLGPFTCIAGYNGVGKSNIFDAIRFLGLLADHTFVEAARMTRGGGDPADLFTQGGRSIMEFECDLLIPATGQDDFHQPAEASHTFLTYRIVLALARDEHELERFELRHEELTYITLGEASSRLGFRTSKEWRESTIRRSNRRARYIETETKGGQTRVRLSSDKMREHSKDRRGGGRPTDFLAASLPRTVLSAAQNADEARTAVLARREMRSWRILQLEPSALRLPDDLQAPAEMTTEGRHLPSTLFRLSSESDGGRVTAEVSNRLASLVDDVREVQVRRDDARRLLQLVLTDVSGREFAASSLSDGTLRFVALSVLERDPSASGLLCLEEPENGIHPERMGAMMALLEEMATDVEHPVDESNPLRQVVVSTHSPVVVAHTASDNLVFLGHRDPPGFVPGTIRGLVVRGMASTWRSRLSGPHGPIGKGDVVRYLGSVVPSPGEHSSERPSTYSAVADQLDLFGTGA